MGSICDSTSADPQRTINELQRQLAERTAQRDEAYAHEAAIAEVLHVINSSRGELAPVFDALLANAVQICGGIFGMMAMREADGFHGVAAHRVGPEFPETLSRLGRPPPGTGLRLLEERLATVQISDAANDPAYDPVRKLNPAFAKIRTALHVPMVRDGALIGAIMIYRDQVQPFTQKEVALVESFAAHALIAIENARLLGELRTRTEEVAAWNRELEDRVAAQIAELDRVGRLKRFLAPQVAELIVSQGDEKILESHRREIVVVFCDLRGYTAFTETAEPEEVLHFLREYHGLLGPLVSQFEGTLDQFSGDGIMVFFNDPLPTPDPANRAVNMAISMRDAAGTLIADWRERGRELGFGAGIAQGYATLGQIGFSERSGYTAIGTVCNIAARLCAEAKDGQILLSQRVNAALRGTVATEQVGVLALKGLTQPIMAYNVPLAATPPVLRLIESSGGPSV